jgi:valyl-tRNA synthetase
LINQTGWKDIVIKLGNLSSFDITSNENESGIGFISETEKCIVAIKTEVDVETQLAEKRADLKYQEGFVKSVEQKLGNERFVSGAPADVVEKERAKLADGLDRIKILKDDIARLENMS